jgi:hypothetical protein
MGNGWAGGSSGQTIEPSTDSMVLPDIRGAITTVDGGEVLVGLRGGLSAFVGATRRPAQELSRVMTQRRR